MSRAAAPLRIGLVAGEASGDTLGADFIRAVRRKVPDAQFFGVAGPKMLAAGCERWEHAEALAVMGLFEVLKELPRLARLLKSLTQRFLHVRPDVFVGIDAPDSNLRIARHLHAAGIPTVQYVSPQVWAWRQGRARTIHRAVDLVLCLLPFEQDFYRAHRMRAEFVGHPLADAIPLQVDRAAARAALSLAPQGEVVALLPGSRRGEVRRLASDFAATVCWLKQARADLCFIAPMASPATRSIFEDVLRREAPGIEVRLLDGQAQNALIASNVVLVASGTATLETALCNRPMVVIYRLGAMTAWLLRRLNLVKAKYFSQPNLLADRRVVGEYFQEDIVPEAIGAELLMWLDDAGRREDLEREFSRIHQQLRRGAGDRAAQAVLDLIGESRAEPGA
jgi:lipid-A-disaccharide synthase